MIDSIPPAPMADEGTDLAYCHECGEFAEVVYIDLVPYCMRHLPLVLSDEDFAMIFEKAGESYHQPTLVAQLRKLFGW